MSVTMAKERPEEAEEEDNFSSTFAFSSSVSSPALSSRKAEAERTERERITNNRNTEILFTRPSYNSCSSVATAAPMAPKEKKDRRNHFKRSFLSIGRSPTNLPFWPFIA